MRGSLQLYLQVKRCLPDTAEKDLKLPLYSENTTNTTVPEAKKNPTSVSHTTLVDRFYKGFYNILI